MTHCVSLQAEVEFKQNDRAVVNMLTVVNMCVKAVQERWQKYDDLFESVSGTVSLKFSSYMHRRGHMVRVQGVSVCEAGAHGDSDAVGDQGATMQQCVCPSVLWCPAL